MKKKRRHVVMTDDVYDALGKLAEARTRRMGGAIRRGGNGVATHSDVLEELIRAQAAREGMPVPTRPIVLQSEESET